MRETDDEENCVAYLGGDRDLGGAWKRVKEIPDYGKSQRYGVLGRGGTLIREVAKVWQTATTCLPEMG